MDTRRATEGPAGIPAAKLQALTSMSRSPTERNAVNMPGSAAAVESREKCGLGARAIDQTPQRKVQVSYV
jgi:hypothetical protein